MPWRPSHFPPYIYMRRPSLLCSYPTRVQWRLRCKTAVARCMAMVAPRCGDAAVQMVACKVAFLIAWLKVQTTISTFLLPVVTKVQISSAKVVDDGACYSSAQSRLLATKTQDQDCHNIPRMLPPRVPWLDQTILWARASTS